MAERGRKQRIGLLLGAFLVPVLAVLALMFLPERGPPARGGKEGGEAQGKTASVASSGSPAPGVPERSTPAEGSPPPAAAGGEPREPVPPGLIGIVKGLLRSGRDREPGGMEVQMEDPAAILLDRNAPLSSRRRAAWLLAQRGDEAALRALEDALPDAPASLKAAIAEALGHSRHPGAGEVVLRIFSTESDETVLCGAVRGIAAMGGKDGAALLAKALNSEGLSMAVRIEAAEGLGSMQTPEALSSLLESYESALSSDADLAKGVLAGLGKRDLAETRSFFENLLDSPGVGQELRLAAVEALEEASGDVGSFLLKYVEDEDAEVRAAAAWSLAVADEPGQVSEDLLNVLGREKDATVRSRIYQALENQEGVDNAAVLEHALSEKDPGARLAASSFLAEQVAAGSLGSGREQFDLVMVPELTEIALGESDVPSKLKAVSVLRRARTAVSLDALREIAGRSTEARVSEAARTGLEKGR